MSGNTPNTYYARRTVARAAKHFKNIENTKRRKTHLMKELKEMFFRMRDEEVRDSISLGYIESSLKRYKELAKLDIITEEQAKKLSDDLEGRITELEEKGYSKGEAAREAYADHVGKYYTGMGDLRMGLLKGGATRRNRRASRKGTRRH